MTKEEADRLTADAKYEAARKATVRVSKWTMPLDPESPGKTYASQIVSKIQEVTQEIQQDTLTFVESVPLDDVRELLTIPRQYTWKVYTTEMTRDLVSGRPIPLVKTECAANDLSDTCNMMVTHVEDYVRALASFARRHQMPNAERFRELYQRYRAYYAKPPFRHPTSLPMDADFADAFFDDLQEAQFTLQCDWEVEQETQKAAKGRKKNPAKGADAKKKGAR